MSTYVGETPSLTIDPRIPKFFEAFYATSDNPAESAHEEYANSLTKDATMVMGSKKVQGHDAILELRKGLWTGPVQKRKHHLKKIYPFGDNSNEMMIYGTVDYGLKNGKDVSVDWAGRALFSDEGGKLKMAMYQVYLVSRGCVKGEGVLTRVVGLSSRCECAEMIEDQTWDYPVDEQVKPQGTLLPSGANGPHCHIYWSLVILASHTQSPCVLAPRIRRCPQPLTRPQLLDFPAPRTSCCRGL